MKVDLALTQKLATLARLRLTEAEVAEFTGQLEKIIDYVGQLQDVELKGVEPLFYPSLTGPDAAPGIVLRPDQEREITNKAGTDSYRVPQVV